MNIRHKQNGAVMILVVVGMVAMLALVGLALDGGHAMLNKTRLQNAVDAAALSGAKVLDLSGDSLKARTAVTIAFRANGAAPGNNEMGKAYADGIIDLQIQFSKTLNPFVSGTIPAEYVRVRARNFRMPVWFSSIVGATEKTVAATAVAGPSPTINVACNIAPMMVCGDRSAGAPNWGFEPDTPQVLKASKPNEEVGAGNFQLIRLGDNTGKADIREAMAGNYDGCATAGGSVDTEPGNAVGPVAQGINTRFGRYDGPMHGTELDYPPDVITEQPSPLITLDDAGNLQQGSTPINSEVDLTYNYDDYSAALASSSFNNVPPAGHYLRRVVAVPMADCDGTANGADNVPVLGFACFFLLQETEGTGNDSNVFGQFIESCNSGGVPGPDPGNAPGLYIIQLYKDPDSPEA